jgi:hypothetical protein
MSLSALKRTVKVHRGQSVGTDLYFPELTSHVRCFKINLIFFCDANTILRAAEKDRGLWKILLPTVVSPRNMPSTRPMIGDVMWTALIGVIFLTTMLLRSSRGRTRAPDDTHLGYGGSVMPTRHF